MTYLITYDLFEPSQNYTSLTNAIRSYGIWAKLGYSCWAIKGNYSIDKLRDDLAQHIDKNDRLFVCAFTDWASLNFDADIVQWLNN